MAKRKLGLGRGLDSLFEESESWGASIQEIPVGELDPNPDQPRKSFDDESITLLAESIRDQGVLQPLIVVAAANGRYRIVAGERRYRASRAAGLETVPCVVKDLDIVHQMEISLIENLQREDLNPIDAAKGIRALMQQCGYTQEKVSTPAGQKPARGGQPAAGAEPAGGGYGDGPGRAADRGARPGAGGADGGRGAAGPGPEGGGGGPERAPAGGAGRQRRAATQEASEKGNGSGAGAGRAAGAAAGEDRHEGHPDGDGQRKGKIVLQYGSLEELERQA